MTTESAGQCLRRPATGGEEAPCPPSAILLNDRCLVLLPPSISSSTITRDRYNNIDSVKNIPKRPRSHLLSHNQHIQNRPHDHHHLEIRHIRQPPQTLRRKTLPPQLPARYSSPHHPILNPRPNAFEFDPEDALSTNVLILASWAGGLDHATVEHAGLAFFKQIDQLASGREVQDVDLIVPGLLISHPYYPTTFSFIQL